MGESISYRSVYGFKLELADGQKWVIVPTQKTALWVVELARMMRLKKTYSMTGALVVIVCDKLQQADNPNRYIKNLKESMIFKLPLQGWEMNFRCASIREWSHSGVSDIICEIGEDHGRELKYIKMFQFLHVIYKRVLDKGGFTCHGALVERDGKGYILSGPGGIGKSTCCRRLLYPWVPLCDDEVLIVRHKEKGYCAHPLPTWSDYFFRRADPTWDVQHYIPVKGIFFLVRAHNDKVTAMGQGEAVVSIKNQAMRIFTQPWGHQCDKDKVMTIRRKVINNTSDFSLHIPAFTLRVSRSGRFWERMEEVIDVIKN